MVYQLSAQKKNLSREDYDKWQNRGSYVLRDKGELIRKVRTLMEKGRRKPGKGKMIVQPMVSKILIPVTLTIKIIGRLY